MYKAVYVPNMLKIYFDILILLCMMIVHIFVHTRERDSINQVGEEPILSYMDLFWCVLIVTASAVVVIVSISFYKQFLPFCESRPVCFVFLGA